MTGPLARAEAILREASGDRVRVDLPIAPLTSFRIGGPAALFLEPETEDDLAAAGRAIVQTDVPFVVIGKGSNLLVSDEGFPGLVLRLGHGYRWTTREGALLRAGGAMPVPALSGVALRHALAGLEFGVAIPASVGGAVRMNAGAHGGAMSDVVSEVDVFRLRQGSAERLSAAQVGFSYRRSTLPDDAVVVATGVTLAADATEHIRARMEEARAWRRRTQPLAEPNCGSVFKNPPGDHAARLIEAAGLKGLRVGGAQVSTKHANFIVADVDARARDVVTLIQTVQDRVEADAGVRLDPEVHLIGAFADAH
jgi:UDP-N-acetylmuramate dehydrogenase